jgi:ParB family chromosome partitioning protein
MAPVPPQSMPDLAAPSAPLDATTIMVSPLALEPGNVGVRGDEPDAPEALVAAIAREGLRQPVLARRKSGADGRFEIIAGRRRWRAAKGLAQIPTVVINLADPEAVLASLTENLGEGTLSAVDEARAYLRLLTEFSLDPRVVCGAIGRDMTHVVRTLRLLGLSPRLRGLIVAGRLTQAQAYALLDAPDPERAADQLLSEQAGVDEALRRIAAVPGGQRP